MPFVTSQSGDSQNFLRRRGRKRITRWTFFIHSMQKALIIDGEPTEFCITRPALALSGRELTVGAACCGKCDLPLSMVRRNSTAVFLCLSATTSCGFTASWLWSTLSSPCCAWLTTPCGWTTKRTRGSVAVASYGSDITGPVCNSSKGLSADVSVKLNRPSVFICSQWTFICTFRFSLRKALTHANVLKAVCVAPGFKITHRGCIVCLPGSQDPHDHVHTKRDLRPRTHH